MHLRTPPYSPPQTFLSTREGCSSRPRPTSASPAAPKACQVMGHKEAHQKSHQFWGISPKNSLSPIPAHTGLSPRHSRAAPNQPISTKVGAGHLSPARLFGRGQSPTGTNQGREGDETAPKAPAQCLFSTPTRVTIPSHVLLQSRKTHCCC